MVADSAIEQDYVVNSAEAIAVIMRGGALPDNLISEIARTQDCIQNDLR